MKDLMRIPLCILHVKMLMKEESMHSPTKSAFECMHACMKLHAQSGIQQLHAQDSLTCPRSVFHDYALARVSAPHALQLCKAV